MTPDIAFTESGLANETGRAYADAVDTGGTRVPLVTGFDDIRVVEVSTDPGDDGVHVFADWTPDDNAVYVSATDSHGRRVSTDINYRVRGVPE